MFAIQNQKGRQELERRVMKEERLEKKKRLEIRWKGMREHREMMRWAEGWLNEELLPTVMMDGKERVTSRVETLVVDIIDMSIQLVEKEKSDRLNRAKKMRERLMVYLERWWTTLGGWCQI